MENIPSDYDEFGKIPEPQIVEVKRDGLPSLWKIVYETRLHWFIGSEDALYESESDAWSIADCNFDPRK
jgi:hypothetical protein